MAMRADAKTYKKMYDRIPQVIQDKVVLEIATGPGLLAKNVAHAAKKMIATDYSEGMIKQALKSDNPPNLTFKITDATNLQYEDNSFDVVLIANALHIIPNPEKALQEIDRVLRPDGTLIAPTFVNHQEGFGSKLWSGILKIAGVRFEHQWSPNEFADFLVRNGWQITHNEVLHSRISMDYIECVRAK